MDQTPQTTPTPQPSQQSSNGYNSLPVNNGEPYISPSQPPVITPTEPEKPTRGMSKRLLLSLIAIITITVIALTGAVYGIYSYYQNATTESTATIKVGLMMAFSGGSASMGYGVNTGVQLAKKQLNADNIEIVQVDSKCDPLIASEVVKTLIDQNVVAIIGEGCSSATVAALPAVNNANIPLISPSASSPTLTIPNDYFFRVVPPDTYQGAFMANTIYDKGYRNVAIFYTNEPYGSGMNTEFRTDFENLGGTVVTSATAEPDVIDLKTQMEQIKAANPEVLFIAPNSVVSAAAAMKVAREVGITAPFYGADIMYNSALIENAPQVAEGLTISSFPTGTDSFKQAIFNETQKNEQLYAASQAYDIIHLLKIAVEKGATTGEEIKNILPSIEFSGVSGHIKFDENGDLSSDNYKYDLFQVQDGVFTLITED